LSAFIGKIHEEEKNRKENGKKKKKKKKKGREERRTAYFCKCDCLLVKYCSMYQAM
jgi:hypothetical protein